MTIEPGTLYIYKMTDANFYMFNFATYKQYLQTGYRQEFICSWDCDDINTIRKKVQDYTGVFNLNNEWIQMTSEEYYKLDLAIGLGKTPENLGLTENTLSTVKGMLIEPTGKKTFVSIGLMLVGVVLLIYTLVSPQKPLTTNQPKIEKSIKYIK